LWDQLGELDALTTSFLRGLAESSGAQLARAGRGDLGGARRGAPLPDLQAALLGGPRSGGAARPRLGKKGDLSRWSEARDEIREAIVTHGWNANRRAYGVSSARSTLMPAPC
jgi:hypothetical protein